MFEPGLANLFEAVVVIGPAAHSVEVLRNNRVIGIRQCEPVQGLIAVITRGGSDAQPHEISITSVLGHFREHSDDDIGPRYQLSAPLEPLRFATAALPPI